jgi:hypothetical protein
MDRRALALLSAALRHVRDAEHLADAGPHQSLDQAYHLAGFGPECARKSVLTKRTFDQAIGHGVQTASESALAFALAMDPAARRYAIEGWGARYPALGAWNERARYEKTGHRDAVSVANVVREAREVVDGIVLSLWADGRIPEGFSW